mgnify:CR=1 FL=1|jgi:hypothetical protein
MKFNVKVIKNKRNGQYTLSLPKKEMSPKFKKKLDSGKKLTFIARWKE